MLFVADAVTSARKEWQQHEMRSSLLLTRFGLSFAGQVAVGGVTDKIEGFFKVCRARGLSGEQGVVLPAANAPDLMLSDEVVDAVREGKFNVWAVENVDQGIELLTGRPAGERRPDGSFAEGTIHFLVAEKLQGYAKLQSEFSRSPNGSRA